MIALPEQIRKSVQPGYAEFDVASRMRASKRSRQRTEIDGVTYKIADCREERESAFRLVYESYVESGLMDENDHKMRVIPHHLQPTTDVFLAIYRGEVVSTVTLVGDDLLGLPMEDVYCDEVNEQRESGAYVSEVSCLASRQGQLERSRKFKVFVQLMGLMAQSARENGIERLLIAVHPRHARFYKRLLGFQQIGGEREYSSVCNNPAVACVHDFAEMDKQRYPLYDDIYGKEFKRWELYRQPMLEDDRIYFAGVSELCEAYLPLAVA